MWTVAFEHIKAIWKDNNKCKHGLLTQLELCLSVYVSVSACVRLAYVWLKAIYQYETSNFLAWKLEFVAVENVKPNINHRWT